jgi:hypothetical protein
MYFFSKSYCLVMRKLVLNTDFQGIIFIFMYKSNEPEPYNYLLVAYKI